MIGGGPILEQSIGFGRAKTALVDAPRRFFLFENGIEGIEEMTKPEYIVYFILF